MRKVVWFGILALAVLLAGCKTGTPTIYGTLSGTVTYAQSADNSNAGQPATDVIVRIRLLEQQTQQGAAPVYIQGEVLFELVLDEKGGYKVELPKGQYLLEVVGKSGAVLAKQMILMQPGKSLRADFNLPPKE